MTFNLAGCPREATTKVSEGGRAVDNCASRLSERLPSLPGRIDHDGFDGLLVFIAAPDESEAAKHQARKHDALRAALEEGERSGIAEDSSLEGVLADFRARRR